MKHTREFKESAIQLVLNSNEEIKTIAQDLGMNAKTLYNWVYNYKRDNNLQTYNRTSSKASVKESSEEELRRLRKENRLLKQERDILKKATAYFAKDLGAPLRGELYKVCMDERVSREFQYYCDVQSIES